MRIELFHLGDRVVARIKRNGKDKFYYVTPASRARLGTYVFRRPGRFHVGPFVTDIVGWTADSNEEAVE